MPTSCMHNMYSQMHDQSQLHALLMHTVFNQCMHYYVVTYVHCMYVSTRIHTLS